MTCPNGMIIRRKIFVSVTTINMVIPRPLLLQADKRGEDINLSRPRNTRRFVIRSRSRQLTYAVVVLIDFISQLEMKLCFENIWLWQEHDNTVRKKQT